MLTYCWNLYISFNFRLYLYDISWSIFLWSDRSATWILDSPRPLPSVVQQASYPKPQQPRSSASNSWFRTRMRWSRQAAWTALSRVLLTAQLGFTQNKVRNGINIKREAWDDIPLQWRHNVRLKSPASRLFTQSFIQAQINENIKAPRYWPLCGEFTGNRWIPHTKGQ